MVPDLIMFWFFDARVERQSLCLLCPRRRTVSSAKPITVGICYRVMRMVWAACCCCLIFGDNMHINFQHVNGLCSARRSIRWLPDACFHECRTFPSVQRSADWVAIGMQNIHLASKTLLPVQEWCLFGAYFVLGFSSNDFGIFPQSYFLAIKLFWGKIYFVGHV